MRYNLYNNDASITIATDWGYYLLLKSSVRNICYVRMDIILIETGCCHGNIFLHQSDVAYPPSYSPQNLINILNDWLFVSPTVIHE
ncbi:MAG: hypothetical protein QM764_09015 [Chitinophagaceae bacterium]